jgi:hypothetical protein
MQAKAAKGGWHQLGMLASGPAKFISPQTDHDTQLDLSLWDANARKNRERWMAPIGNASKKPQKVGGTNWECPSIGTSEVHIATNRSRHPVGSQPLGRECQQKPQKVGGTYWECQQKPQKVGGTNFDS